MAKHHKELNCQILISKTVAVQRFIKFINNIFYGYSLFAKFEFMVKLIINIILSQNNFFF